MHKIILAQGNQLIKVKSELKKRSNVDFLVNTKGKHDMEISDIIKLFVPEGVWATLSIFLVFYIIKTQGLRDAKQDEREQKYQEIIFDLSEALSDLNEIKEILRCVFVDQKKD